jgi:carbamoyl-phosphate synthase large subunit
VDWEFVAEEFLPGRDYAWTSIWYEGRLVCSTARERLQYMYPHLAPSGRTGTPVLAKTVHSEAVNVMATEAVLSVSTAPHGVYCVDLRCDAAGTPRPTEINCGRFFTTSYHTAAMGVNFPDIYVRLAMGEPPPRVPQYNTLPDGLSWMRHIDCPGIVLGPWDEVPSGEWSASSITAPEAPPLHWSGSDRHRRRTHHT